MGAPTGCGGERRLCGLKGGSLIRLAFARPLPLMGRLKVSLRLKAGRRGRRPLRCDYLLRDSIGHCAGHTVSFWSKAIESRHSFLQNDTLKGFRRNTAGARCAPLQRLARNRKSGRPLVAPTGCGGERRLCG